MLYFTSHLYYYLFTITQKIDVYISSEKYLNKLKNGLDSCKEEEFQLFKEKLVENFGLLCVKSKVEISNNIKNFFIDLLITHLVENSNQIISNKELLIFYFKRDKKHNDQENSEIDNLMRSVSIHLDAFHNYLVQFTNDITTGKKIWKNLEDKIKNKIDNPQQNQLLIEIIITYIFSKSKTHNSDENKCKLIFSTIFEFLCDKLSSSKMKVMGESQSVNLHLFYEIIYNYVDVLIDDILNERYMQFFARIFIEDCLAEVVNKTIDENEKQLLLRLHDIISKHKEPLKLYISLINNTGKLFNLLKEENYFLDEQKETSKKLLMKIYIKLNLLLTKYSIFPNYDKVTLERDEVLIIISNFSTNIPELIPHYITFFIKFFFFIESHFKIEIDFKHRKNIIIFIFEMFYELTLILNENKIVTGFFEKNWNEEFVRLAELFYLICKNYSNNSTEDAYLFYRNCGALLKKILQTYSEQLTETQISCIVFLVFMVINMVCKYYHNLHRFNELSGLYVIFNNIYDNFKVSIEYPVLKENIDRLFSLIEQNYLIDAFKIMRNFFTKKQNSEKLMERKDILNLKRIDLENPRQIFAKTLLNLHNKFFSVASQFSQTFDEIMISKGYQVFVREFSQEMTFRDMNKANKEYDNLTEHSFLVSNRDFDFFANDSMKIAFGYDERKSILPIQFSDKKESNILKSPFAINQEVFPQQQAFEIKLRSIEDGEEIENKLSKMSNYAFDDYFKNNDINEIKI